MVEMAKSANWREGAGVRGVCIFCRPLSAAGEPSVQPRVHTYSDRVPVQSALVCGRRCAVRRYPELDAWTGLPADPVVIVCLSLRSQPSR